ncbi:MAG TPA: methyltransferase [Kofleriaceae bacterium]|jgi:hypothetical protein
MAASTPTDGGPPSAAVEHAAAALRDYLDQLGFVQLYKFIATPSFYHADPNLLSLWQLRRVADFDAYVAGDRSGYGIATCLMLAVAVPRGELTPIEQRLADQLVDAGLLTDAGECVAIGPYQLISAQDMPLLIDARINFPGQVAPRVYFGRDSLLLPYYLDAERIGRDDRALDLGTGAGLGGLVLGRRSDHVIATDISPDALRLAGVNRLLNHMTRNVAIRDERVEDTVERGERYAVVTFNPPFTPLPDGLRAPAFARGAGRDGLGYCRLVIERLDDLLVPDGTAYLTASLLGDPRGPFFADELRRFADLRRLRIDVFIEATSELAAGNAMFQALGAFLHRDNPTVSAAECQSRVEQLQLRTLGATAAFLSVLVVRRARDLPPSLRVFHRRAGLPFPPAEVRPA